MQGQSLEEGRYVGNLGSPRTGVIAHVHPETSISKQQTHQSGEPIWHAFTQFVKKTSVVCESQYHITVLRRDGRSKTSYIIRSLCFISEILTVKMSVAHDL